jgi:hypothetical protein
MTLPAKETFSRIHKLAEIGVPLPRNILTEMRVGQFHKMKLNILQKHYF